MARISTNQQRAEAFNAVHVPEKHLHLCSQVIHYNLFQPRSGPPACLAAAYKSVGTMMSLTSGRMIREKGSRKILQHILVNVLWDLLDCQLIFVKTKSWHQNWEDSNGTERIDIVSEPYCFLHLLAVDFLHSTVTVCSINLGGPISVRLWLTCEGAYNNSLFSSI